MRTLKHALLAGLLAGAALIPAQSQAFFGWMMPWNWGGWDDYYYPYYGPYGYSPYWGGPYGYGGYPYGGGYYPYSYSYSYYGYPVAPVAPTAPAAPADK